MVETAAAEKSTGLAPLSMMGRAAMPTVQSVEDHLHELRVRIPVDLHRQLLSLKVLRGKSLAETVSKALDVYFAEHAKRIAEASEQREL